MKYQSIIIVTYARSGSTLLQGVLNSIDGVHVRGENNDFCWGLYLSWKALNDAYCIKGSSEVLPKTDPWYGADDLKPELFLRRCTDLVREQLVNGQGDTCYGFKEIRYTNHLNDLPGYLDFLQLIFPNLAIIFNTRAHIDVEKSEIWKHDDRKKVRQLLRNADRKFHLYALKNKNSFIMRYEHMIRGIPGIKPLFDFLECDFEEGKVIEVLETKHSYAQKESTLEFAKGSMKKGVEQPELSDGTSKKVWFEELSRLYKCSDQGVIVISIVKNESVRIPWFLNYYRGLGVKEFIFIDNGSEDTTVEYLLQQADVLLYHSDPSSYASSRSGRLWINEIVLKHALGRWALVVDSDELISWPNCETEKLPGLVKYAERLGLKRIFTPLIDAYADAPVIQLPAYVPGEPFGAMCPWIDPVSGAKARILKDRRLMLHSGPRLRYLSDSLSPPPLMTKQTLYYVEHNGYSHVNSHFDNTVQPSPLVAPLLHYKFLPNFSKKIDEAIQDGQHWEGAAEFKDYRKFGLEGANFKTNESVMITSGEDLREYIGGITTMILREYY